MALTSFGRHTLFSSLNDLRAKLLRYIRHYNKTATPIKWTYSNPKQRIKP